MTHVQRAEIGSNTQDLGRETRGNETRLAILDLRSYFPKGEKLSLLERVHLKKNSHHFGRTLAHVCLQRIFGNSEYDQMLEEAKQAGLLMDVVKQGYYERLDETDEGDFDASV